MSQIIQWFLAANWQREEGKERRKGRREARKVSFTLKRAILLPNEIHSCVARGTHFQHMGHCFWTGCQLCTIYVLDKERLCFETSGWCHITRKSTNLEGQGCHLSLKTRWTMEGKGVLQILNHVKESTWPLFPHSHQALDTHSIHGWWNTGITVMSACIDIGEVLILGHMIRTWVRQTALVSWAHTDLIKQLRVKWDPPLLTNCVFLGKLLKLWV